jgi:hypothetical protein
MSNVRHDFRELQELLELLCDDRADSQQLAQIQQLVQSSPAAMQFYVDYLDQHARLLWRFRRFAADVFGDSTPEMLAVVNETTSAPLCIAPPVSIGDAASNAGVSSLGNEGDGGIAPGIIFPSWLSPLSIFSLVAVGAMVIAGLVLFSSQPSGPGNPSASSPIELAYGRVNSVRLESGVTTLVLDKVGTVTIDGPTDFCMVGTLRARLNYGNITVHVTEVTGHGFVVETPDGDVTDFGTKFTLNVSKGKDTKLIVREGSVDLQPGTWRQNNEQDRRERLVGGQAVSFNAAGNIQRIVSIVTGLRRDASDIGDSSAGDLQPLIAGVSDNLHDPQTKSYYEIVPRGLREDASAYVDRVHEWNGVTRKGMPKYLLGADYVKPFNDDRMNTEGEIVVTLSRPARLLVFFDTRLTEPEWLLKDFHKSRDVIGLDMGPTDDPAGRDRRIGVGPSKSVSHQFSIWERRVTEPGSFVLGPNYGSSDRSGMYGIAAVEIKEATAINDDGAVLHLPDEGKRLE